MMTGKPAKAVALHILGEPLGRMVESVSVRPPSDAERQQWAGSGLTVGDVWTFEMDKLQSAPRQFVVTSK